MRNFFVLLICALLFSACMPTAKAPAKWEYKIVKMSGQNYNDFVSLSFEDQTPMLNRMGKEGWELVSSFTEIETVHPNFGNSEYVTGIRENTRTNVIAFVFKRQIIEQK